MPVTSRSRFVTDIQATNLFVILVVWGPLYYYLSDRYFAGLFCAGPLSWLFILSVFSVRLTNLLGLRRAFLQIPFTFLLTT